MVERNRLPSAGKPPLNKGVVASKAFFTSVKAEVVIVTVESDNRFSGTLMEPVLRGDLNDPRIERFSVFGAKTVQYRICSIENGHRCQPLAGHLKSESSVFYRVKLEVRMRGFEPPRGCPHWHLKPARLPIPPHPLDVLITKLGRLL